LLHNLDRVYIDTEHLPGPHVMLTSATSWLPHTAQFHLTRHPDAVLMLTDEARPQSAIHMEFRPVAFNEQRIKVSGTGQYRDQNLRYIVRQLAVSDLQDELDCWQSRGEARKILLVVNSYEQARIVQDELQQIPVWRDRVMRLIPDDATDSADMTIRARQVERLYQHRRADVLIVPLMAIQRGFNILDEADGALLGTACFLVRPYPPPDDLGPQILSLNAWWMRRLSHYSRLLKTGSDLPKLRQAALKAWNRRLRNVSRGMDRLDNDLYREFLRDQFIPIWQTIGRLVRGGRDARVFFIDGAFGSSQGKRHMLLDWYQMLDALRHSNSDADTFLAQPLYENAYVAFKEAVENGRIF